MSTIVTRSGKGSPLTHNEVDANFTNLNADKVEKTAADITGGTIDNTSIGATTPSTVNATTITGQTGQLNGTGQNLITYSEQLDNAAWIEGSLTSVTPNTVISPDGTLNGDTVEATGTNTTQNFLYNSYNTSIVSGSVFTFSVWLKADVPQTIQLRVANASNTDGLDLSVALTTTWQRFTLTRTFSTTSTAIRVYVFRSTEPTVFYAWGAQLELASSAGTYIPTTTTAVYGTPTLSFSGVSSIGLLSNGALYLQPAGTGALQAQATTSTTAGGNARGANAVDWQTSRASATQVASSGFSVIGGGSGNTASTSNGTTIAGGRNNNATAQDCFVGGGNANTASGLFSSSVGGTSNVASGYYGFVGSGASNSTTSNSAVTTQSATMNGTTAVTLSGSNASIRVGQFITGTSIAAFTYVAAISGTSLTLSQAASGSSTSTLSFFTPHGVVVGGGNNQATGSYSFIGGGGDAGTAANRNVASGDWSFVGGGQRNTASGIGSVIAGGGFDGTTALQNTASGTGSVVLGGASNVASSSFTIAGGRDSTASGNRSTALGNHATTRGVAGNVAFSGCANPISGANGVSQAGLLVLARQTTDATPTALTSDSVAAGTTNQVILPNNSAYFFRGEVVSGKTAAGDTKGWTIEGVIKRGANAASTALVGIPTVTSTYADLGAATWDIAVTADTTNGGIRVTFTGQAATTIRTVCQIRTTEMTF
jgi:hypothetical protein